MFRMISDQESLPNDLSTFDKTQLKMIVSFCQSWRFMNWISSFKVEGGFLPKN